MLMMLAARMSMMLADVDDVGGEEGDEEGNYVNVIWVTSKYVLSK